MPSLRSDSLTRLRVPSIISKIEPIIINIKGINDINKLVNYVYISLRQFIKNE